MGIKIVNIVPDDPIRSLPALHSLCTLFDATTGQPLALLDGPESTNRRTAAASALAASWLAPAKAHTLLLVGSGQVARLLPDANHVVRPIERVLVWSCDPQHAGDLAEQLRADGFDARAETSLEHAVAQAAVISCATLAHRPLVRRLAACAMPS